ncbi:MAG TPA: DegT/DnrJ/EryC1/StrS family aminotransferase [Candidatus Peribacteraceae bacterium]|nr:DegT/DnrJ/EryC1/StrS family aminotransferase [Candidatus Peribacteraceae bacterium]
MPPYVPYVSKDFLIEGSRLRLDDKEKAWAEIDGRMRTAIRKARESGAVIRKAQGTKEELATFRSFCLNPDDMPEVFTDRYHLYLAELDREIIAGILVVEVGSKLFMLCHASTPVAKRENIPSLLIWHIVEEFTGNHFAYLDVGASYRPSLQNFFQGWRTSGYPMIMKPPELQPSLMLTPFDTQAMDVPVATDARSKIASYLTKKFAGRPYTFFPRGMYAIFTLIRWLKNEGKIHDGDNVWITTTTDTHYVSSCVTSAIEQTVPVSRALTDRTKAIFVIHEFGFPHPRLKELRAIADERNIPLIEDCAYSWGTAGTGMTGDYVIYSLTKAFPVQFGGYLVGKKFSHEELWQGYGCSDRGKEEYTETRLAHWIGQEDASMQRRRDNYDQYRALFGDDRVYFPLAEGVVPGAFVLRIADEEAMKTVSAFVRRFGIECGNYWQNSAIILPVHQRVAPAHLAYIAGAVLATEREWCGVPGSHQ